MALALLSLSIDCADAGKLAAFWAGVLGLPVDPGATPESASVGASNPGAATRALVDGRRPQWGPAEVWRKSSCPNRMSSSCAFR